MVIRKSSYYNFRRLLSYNGVWNFVLGGRGIGKTYGSVKKAISDSLYKDKEFIYVRRYSDDIKFAKATFFERIKIEFPKWEFRVNGWQAEAAEALPKNFDKLEPKQQKEILKAREWKVIGYFLALSQAQRVKSGAFPRVYKIIFDEFILEKGLTRYLPKEYEVFNSLYETVDRKEERVTVIFIANSVSIDNPYFVHYGVEPDSASNEILVMFDGFLVVHFPESAEYQQDAQETRHGRFLMATDPEYADYATGNKFRDNTQLMVEGKPYSADCLYILETEKGTFSVWNKLGSPVFYIDSRQPTNIPFYTMVAYRMGPGKIFLDVNNRMFTILRSAWARDEVRFDKPATRVAFMEVFHR
jgi:hypothetical protein